MVLTLCFIGTAITINLTYTADQLLVNEGREIERNIQAKEKIVYDFLADSSQVTTLKQLSYAVDDIEEVIANFVDKHNIYVHTYVNHNLEVWTTDKYVPQTNAGIREGTSVIKADNVGWFASIKYTEGTFSVLFLIPIKSDYQKTNDFLQNTFAPDIITSNNLTIADYRDQPVYNVVSSDRSYLFSVKLLDQQHDTFFSKLELIMWLMAGFSTLVISNLLCIWISKQGYTWLSILLFAAFLLGVRYIDLELGWLSSHFYMGIFDPRYFASSFFFPHLGAFLLNMLCLAWFVGYVYALREQLTLPLWTRSKYGQVLVVVVCGVLTFLAANVLSSLFSSLVSNSDINFDLTNMLGLTVYSWLGIFALWLGMVTLLFVVDTMVTIAFRVMPDVRTLVFIQSIGILGFFIIRLSLDLVTLSFFCFSALVYLRTWYLTKGKRGASAVFVATLLLLGGIAATKHAVFQQEKRREEQKFMLLKLVAREDIDAEALFSELEHDIVDDPFLISYLRDPSEAAGQVLEEHLGRTYLSGYLSKYEFSASFYDNDLVPVGNSSASRLVDFRDRVISGAIKVSENLNFYRGNTSFGNFEYFAQLPISDEVEQVGILLISLTNQSFNQRRSYPDILTDGRVDRQQSDLLAQYSYGFYQDGRLVSQHGKYIYPITDERYPGELRRLSEAGRDAGFGHMAYRPNERSLVVLSKPQQDGWIIVASLSFLFLVFLILTMVAYAIRWIIVTLNNNGFSLRNLKWSISISQNRILYSTRIQMFMVVAVVLTLMTAGVITYFGISRQFKLQQQNTSLRYVNDVASGLEMRIFSDIGQDGTMDTGEYFNAIAESMTADINLFNSSGELIYSTQPKIFDLKLLSRYMDAKAFVQLSKYERSEYISDRRIGKLQYYSVYAPIRNEHYDAIGFLSLPNYGAQKEFDENIGMLLNTLINIYALVILILGLFAVFVANKIAKPLLLVQRSLAKTTIGKQNEPIFWKRNDEIGSLIKEYNLMIVALEENANRLVRSERESAWREMAKQVAHEIKNPLTPLKLGIQHLERSWKEEDPRFDEKFKRFTTSFIEQIESLSHIASEFSNFAKMPDTKLEKVDVREVLQHAVAVYQSNASTAITLKSQLNGDEILVKGDRDQLLRSFNNLIKNAVEAGANKRKSKIDLTVYQVEGDQVVVSIRDNGEGIPHDVREKLFQPNFTTKSSGTGLGLAFVKQAIEGMGGTISYETVVGKGTTFYLSIPTYGDSQ